MAAKPHHPKHYPPKVKSLWRLSWSNLVIFVVVFGGIGYLIYTSFAASSVGNLSSEYQGKILQYKIAPSSGANVQNEAGTQALYAYLEKSIQTYGPWAQNGQDSWVNVAYYFPSSSTHKINGWWDVWGVKGWGGSSFNGVAPWNLNAEGGEFHMSQNSGSPTVHYDSSCGCYKSGGLPQWGPHYNASYDMGPVSTNTWINFVLHFHWAHDNTGYIEFWRNGQVIVPKTSTVTLSADDDRMRWPHETSYYPGAPTNSLTPTTFYAAPMLLGHTTSYEQDPLPPLNTQVTDGNSHIYADTAASFGVPAPPAPVAGAPSGGSSSGGGGTTTPPPSGGSGSGSSSGSGTPVFQSSSLVGGQTVSGTVDWTVTGTGSIASVEYWAGGTKLDTDTSAPWSYSLDTTKLPNGPVKINVLLDGTDGSRISAGSGGVLGTITVDNTSSASGSGGSQSGNPPSAPITGDLNSDGKINISDLSIMLAHFGRSGTSLAGDLNSDGRVDIIDLSILLSNWQG